MNTDLINNWLHEKLNFILSNKEIIIMILPVIWCFFITWEYMFEKKYCKYWGIEKWYKKTFSIAFHPKYAASLFLSIMWLCFFYCIIELTPIKPFFKYLSLFKIIFIFSIINGIILLLGALYFISSSIYFYGIEQLQKEMSLSELTKYRVKARKVNKMYFSFIRLLFWINTFLIAVCILSYFEKTFGFFCILFIILYYLFNEGYFCSFKKGEIRLLVNYFNVIEDNGNYYSILLPVQESDGKNNLIVRTTFCKGKTGLVTAYLYNSDCKYIDSISNIKVSRVFFDKIRRITFENLTILSSKEKEEVMNAKFIINKEEEIYLKGEWVKLRKFEENKKSNAANSKKKTKK